MPTHEQTISLISSHLRIASDAVRRLQQLPISKEPDAVLDEMIAALPKTTLIEILYDLETNDDCAYFSTDLRKFIASLAKIVEG